MNWKAFSDMFFAVSTFSVLTIDDHFSCFEPTSPPVGLRSSNVIGRILTRKKLLSVFAPAFGRTKVISAIFLRGLS